MINKIDIEMSVLQEISEALVLLGTEEALDKVLSILSEKLGMTRGTIVLLDSKGELSIQVAQGLTDEEKARGKYKIGEGVTGKVVETGEPIVVPRIGKDSMFLDKTKAREKVSKEDTSFVCVPIKFGQNVLGAFSVDKLFTEDTSFDEDLKLLNIIAAMIAQAIRMSEKLAEEEQRLTSENIHLRQELKEKYNI
ncbi:GAF domain-containing protein, partial [bacterium]|nr:GAF domain-containing protein [bacterium]